MWTLVLELRLGEVMIAPIRFRTKSRIAWQSAYIGAEDERAGGLVAARAPIAAFKEATTSLLTCEILDRDLGFAVDADAGALPADCLAEQPVAGEALAGRMMKNATRFMRS